VISMPASRRHRTDEHFAVPAAEDVAFATGPLRFRVSSIRPGHQMVLLVWAPPSPLRRGGRIRHWSELISGVRTSAGDIRFLRFWRRNADWFIQVIGFPEKKKGHRTSIRWPFAPPQDEDALESLGIALSRTWPRALRAMRSWRRGTRKPPAS
jgi:hypothetical protein